jgi:hypothetical protein
MPPLRPNFLADGAPAWSTCQEKGTNFDAEPVGHLARWENSMAVRFSLVTAVISTLVLVSCGESQAVIVQRRDARRAEINARYERLLAHSTNQWNQLVANVQELLGKKVLVAANGSPVQRVDRSDEMLAATARCQAVVAPDGGASAPADPWGDQGPTELERCQSEWSELYVAALRKAYPQADAGAVSKTYDDDGRTEDIEVLMAASHNAAIEAIVAAKKSRLKSRRTKTSPESDSPARASCSTLTSECAKN